MFRPKVERWRSIVRKVAPGIPASLVLAIITRESGGEPGLPGRSRDDGLMQCKPAVVAGYNKVYPDKPINHARMRGIDIDSATDQIRVGSWFIGHCLRLVHKWNPKAAPAPAAPLTDYQILLADLCYARGGPGTKALRKRALAAGYPDTFDGLYSYRQAHQPQWGKPGWPFRHASSVLDMTRKNGVGSKKKPGKLPAIPGETPDILFFALGLGAIYFLSNN